MLFCFGNIDLSGSEMHGYQNHLTNLWAFLRHSIIVALIQFLVLM